MADDAYTLLRTSDDEERLLEWSLVLSSASIVHRLERTTLGAALIVHADDAARANALLADYDAEELRPRPAPPPPPPDYGFTPAALITAAGLLAFHFVTGGAPATRSGSCAARRAPSGSSTARSGARSPR